MGKNKNINSVLTGETTNDDDLKISNYNLDNYLGMKYTPRISMDVDRKIILTSTNSQYFQKAVYPSSWL